MTMKKKKRPQKKHVPIRMCIVTRERKPKTELMRFVRIEDEVTVDPKGKERGRGANITMDVKVFDEAIKKGLIEKALKLKKKFKKDKVAELRKAFVEAIELRNFRQGKKPVTIKVDKEKLKKALSK